MRLNRTFQAQTQAAPEMRNASTSPIDWELVWRREVRDNGYYLGKQNALVLRMMEGYVAALQRPAGRADRQGSQECECLLECATLEPLESMLLLEPTLVHHPLARCVIAGNGEMLVRTSRNTCTFVCESALDIAKFLRLHERGLPPHLHVFGSSKGVPPTSANGHTVVKVTVMALPPLIIELTRRGSKSSIRTRFNKATLNDVDGFRLPPHFKYTNQEGPHFRAMMLQQVLGMDGEGAPMSDRFIELASA